MNRFILSLFVCFVSIQAGSNNWNELKTGDDVLKCFGARAQSLAAPLFGGWRAQPAFNPEEKTFTATWDDRVGGGGSLRLVTGAPPALLNCEWARGKNLFDQNVTGIVCVTTMNNGVVYADFDRAVRLSRETAKSAEKIPLIVIQNRKMWCTN